MESADKNQDQEKEIAVNQSAGTEAEEEKKKVVEKVLFSWTAPARPFKRRNREFYITVIAIAIIVGLVLFLAEGFMPVILLASLVFLFYVLNTVEPENIEYKITNKGISISGRKTEWKSLTRFWFSRRYDNQLLIFGMYTIPGRMEFVINSGDKETLSKTIKKYLPEEEVPPSQLDKAANWFAKKLPGNN